MECRFSEITPANAHLEMDVNAAAAGFRSASGENVLMNMAGMDGTVATGFEQWRTSSGHNKNMLGDWSGVGCGWADCGDRRITWTCIYGRP